ncbi:MAG TPA: hypothetical protein VIL20_11205 [Sandaracinaceae bacterium]
MRISWLTLALVASLALAGCFDAHGVGPDAGTVVDGGSVMCELRPALVQALACPSVVGADQEATVTVTTTPRACCSSGTVRSSVSSSGARHTITLEWDACECCDDCRCVAPMQDVTVALGVLPVGEHEVEAHGHRCRFEVVPPIGDQCRPASAAEVRAPAHLLAGQEYAVTLTSEGGRGCGCTPRVAGLDELDVSLELCECCEACECIDPGYQASAVRGPLPVGTHSVALPHGTAAVTVHAPTACRPIAATSVTIVPPRRDLILGGPALTWARVEGEELLCCAEPVPVVEQLDTTGPEIVLRLSSCVEYDCACVPTVPRTASAWFSLGELAPGSYTLRVGDVRTTFEVE